MGLRLTPHNKYRYTLQHNNFTPLIIDEPVDYDTSKLEISRHKGSDGINFQQSKKIRFVGNARTFLILIDQYYDIKAQIRLLVDVRNPETNDWDRDEEGFLDMEGMEIDEQSVSLQFNISGLSQLIKSRSSQKIELERLTDLNGNIIEPLKIDRISLSGRKIFLTSLLETLDEDRFSDAFRMNYQGGNVRWGYMAIPTTVSYSSDELIHTTFKNTFLGGTQTVGTTGQMFYAVSDRDKTLKLKIAVDCIIENVKVDDLRDFTFSVDLVTYENGTSYDEKTRTTLYSVPNPYNMHNHRILFEFEDEIDILQGESLSLQWYGKAKFGGTVIFVDYDGDMKVNFSNTIATINVDEDSHVEPSQSNCLYPFEMADRILEIITGEKDVLVSKPLGRTELGYDEDGVAALIVAYHGLWVRGFESGDERYKGITTSWKEFMEAYSALWGLGYGVEIIDGRERVVIAEKSYFKNRNVTIRLGQFDENGQFQFTQVSNVHRARIAENYYSSIEVGSEKGGEYDEVMGLDEPNGKSSFSTCVSEVIQNVLQIITKYQRDSLGEEITRRKQKVNFGTTDTPRDKNIFVKDAKRSSTDVLVERFWPDDMEKAPTGIYNPETATNLRLSQVNMMLRHGAIISSSFIQYPYEYVRFGESTANDKLTTQLIGGNEYSENGDIRNSDLDSAISNNWSIEYDYPMSYELKQLIKGSTEILGETIPNLNGLIEFKNEFGGIERAHFENIVLEDESKWKVTGYNNK